MAQSISAELTNLDKKVAQLDSSLEGLIQKAQQWNQVLSQGVTNNNIAQMKKEFEELGKAQTQAMESYAKSLSKVEEIERSLSRTRKNNAKIQENSFRAAELKRTLLGEDGVSGIYGKLNTLGGILPTSVDWNSILKTTNAQSGQSINNIAAGAKNLTNEERERLRIQREQSKELKKQQREQEKMINNAGRIGSLFAGAFAVGKIKDFYSQMIKVRGEFEMQEVALRNIIKSQRVSSQIWDKTLQLALESPLTAMQLVKYTKQLAAFRIESTKLYDTTKMLADVSVGLGVDMERLILAYGHTKSSGFLRGMYARQFATAGVNIYGELADYYTQMEGKTVTFKDVYDRISKKLVTFADVEAVFKKLTSEGGQFFNMQKVLSDTVQGQINKLKDAWQQLLNTLGQARTGVLRTVIDMLLRIITDYRQFVTMIRVGAAGVLAWQLADVALALFKVDKAFVSASSSAKLFASGLQGVGRSLKGGLIQAGISALVMAIVGLISASAEWKRKQDEIFSIETDFRKSIISLERYRDEIEENNKAIRKEEGAQKDSNEAREENERLLQQLKEEYPDYLSQLEAEKNGYIDIRDAINGVIEAERRRMRLAAIESETGGMFNDTTGENVNDLQREFTQNYHDVTRMVHNLENEITKLSEGGLTEDEKIKVEGYQKMIDAFKENQDNVEVVLDKWQDIFYREYYTYSGTVGRPAGSLLDKKFNPAKIQKEFHDRMRLAGDVAKYGEEMTKNLAIDLQSVREYSEEMAAQKLNPMEWFVKNSERVEKDIQSGKIPNYLEYYQTWFRNNLNVASKEMETATNKMFNRNFSALFPGLQSNFNWWVQGPATSSKTENPPKGLGTENSKKSISTLVELLKKMNSEYVKLKENAYGAAKSQEKVMEGYKDAFDEIFGTGGNALVDWNKVDITSKAGVVAAIDELIANLDKGKSGGWGKYQKDAKKQVKKLQAELKTEIGVEIEVVKREEFEKKMDNLFKDYELTVELKGLNISQDAAQAMFDFEYQSLWDLQKAMDEFYAEQKKNSLGNLLDKKAWEAYQKYAEKIEGEIYKERKERAKKYSDFLKQELSERAKLTRDYYENMALVSSEGGFSEEEKKRIINNLTEAYKKALQKLDWEDFKNSDFYVEMMEDLTEMPVRYMEIMLQEVNKVLENAEILPPRALKEALRARREVQEAILGESSLKEIIRRTLKAFKGAYREREDFDEYNTQAEQEMYGGKYVEKTPPAYKKKKKLLEEAIALRTEEIKKLDDQIKKEDELAGRVSKYLKAEKELVEARAKMGYGGDVEVGEKYDLERGDFKSALDESTADLEEYKTIIRDLQAQYAAEADKKDEADKKVLKDLAEQIEANKILKQQAEEDVTMLTAKVHEWDRLIAKQKEYDSIAGNLQPGDANYTSQGAYDQLVSGTTTKKNRRDTLTSTNLKQKDTKKRLKEFEREWEKLSAKIKEVNEQMKSLGTSAYEMLEALGAETNVVTDAWKNFADSLMDTITGALTMIPALVIGFVNAGTAINAAMGIIGLIAEAIQLVITLITALAQLHDSYIKKDLEDSKKRVDALSKAYDRLKESIDATITAAEYFVNYSETIANINEQIQEANFRLQEAQGLKKKADREEAIAEAEDALEDLRKKLRETEADLQDTFGGIARDDFRSWAEDFVSAWTDAFKETGDGYDALMETFEEKMMDTFKKQALMRGLAKIMEPVANAINSFVGDDGVLDEAELADIRERMRVAADNGDAYMRQMAELFDLSAEGSLSGLTAGIQGMTEEQADVLTGYWNSVRLYAAEIDLHVGMIADAFNNPESTNPMLNQIRLIARNTESINSLLDSVSKGGHTLGGTGIKVFVQ